MHSQAPPSPVSGPFLVVGKGLVVGKAVLRAPGRKGKLDIGEIRAPQKPPPHPTRAGLLPSSSASRGRNTQVSLRPCLVRWCRGCRGPGGEARVPRGLDKGAGGEACAGRLAVCSLERACLGTARGRGKASGAGVPPPWQEGPWGGGAERGFPGMSLGGRLQTELEVCFRPQREGPPHTQSSPLFRDSTVIFRKVKVSLRLNFD